MFESIAKQLRTPIYVPDVTGKLKPINRAQIQVGVTIDPATGKEKPLLIDRRLAPKSKYMPHYLGPRRLGGEA